MCRWSSLLVSFLCMAAVTVHGQTGPTEGSPTSERSAGGDAAAEGLDAGSNSPMIQAVAGADESDGGTESSEGSLAGAEIPDDDLGASDANEPWDDEDFEGESHWWMPFAWLGVILFAILGGPLFIVMGGAALLAFYGSGGESMFVITELYGKMSSAPTLLAIPLFTFAGYLMAEGGTSRRLLGLSRTVLGWAPGGLSIVALMTCAFFTAFTGASGVTIIALGGLLFPALVADGYPEDYSLGLLTACGSLGLLFPPSLPIILYGIVANRPDYPTNIDDLWIAGAVPGILLVLVLSGYGIYMARKSKVQLVPFKTADVKVALREAAWEIPLPILVLVGIYGGYFTANQAAAVTAAYVLVVQVVIYKDLHIWRDVPRVARDSMVLVGGILIILGAALGLTNFLIDQGIPDQLLALIRQYIHSRFAFFVALNIFLLLVGCLMDIFSAIIVVVPLITPLAKEYGVDPIHLGIIFLTNLEIGYLTPPVGINLFISSFRFKRPVLTLYRASIPFLILLLGGLIVITYWPGLSLGLLHWLRPESIVVLP